MKWLNVSHSITGWEQGLNVGRMQGLQNKLKTVKPGAFAGSKKNLFSRHVGA